MRFWRRSSCEYIYGPEADGSFLDTHGWIWILRDLRRNLLTSRAGGLDENNFLAIIKELEEERVDEPLPLRDVSTP